MPNKAEFSGSRFQQLFLLSRPAWWRLEKVIAHSGKRVGPRAVQRPSMIHRRHLKPQASRSGEQWDETAGIRHGNHGHAIL